MISLEAGTCYKRGFWKTLPLVCPSFSFFVSFKNIQTFFYEPFSFDLFVKLFAFSGIIAELHTFRDLSDG